MIKTMIQKNNQHLRQNHLILMVKTPKRGQVKTRLARGIGWGEATQFYRRTATRLITQLSQDPRWRTFIAISPDASQGHWPWPKAATPEPQGTGNLGTRMQNLFANHAPNPTLIIGTDIPAITAAHIHQAFKAIHKSGFAIAPSGDGGYWGVGQKNCPTTLQAFKNVRWSTEHALDDTIQNIPKKKLTMLNAPLPDIDEKADYDTIPSNRKQRWIQTPEAPHKTNQNPNIDLRKPH